MNYIGRNIWRSAIWYDKEKVIYGIHASNSELFSFDTKKLKVSSLIFMGKDGQRIKRDNVYPTLSLCLLKNRIFYCFVDGLFDYSRSEKIKNSPTLISYDIGKNKKTNHGFIKYGQNRLIGVGGSTITDNGILYLIGAVTIRKNQNYNKFNILNGEGFRLGLIEIDTNKLTYEH